MSRSAYLPQLRAVDPAAATPARKEVLDRAITAVGFLPDRHAHVVNAPAVLSTDLHGDGLFRSESGLSIAAGFEEHHVLCIVLALAVKTLGHDSNHAFATPVDPVLAASAVAPKD